MGAIKNNFARKGEAQWRNVERSVDSAMQFVRNPMIRRAEKKKTKERCILFFDEDELKRYLK